MQVTTIGLDLAKNVFQVHGITDDGSVAFNRALRRAQVLSFFEKLEPCLVGIEACGTSHHWARELSKLGHTIKLISPAYVKPYVKRGKSDAADAEAICEAVTRPTMRFVEVKTPEQQAILVTSSFGNEPRQSICCGRNWQSLALSCLKEFIMPFSLPRIV
jgi:transposase